MRARRKAPRASRRRPHQAAPRRARARRKAPRSALAHPAHAPHAARARARIVAPCGARRRVHVARVTARRAALGTRMCAPSAARVRACAGGAAPCGARRPQTRAWHAAPCVLVGSDGPLRPHSGSLLMVLGLTAAPSQSRRSLAGRGGGPIEVGGPAGRGADRVAPDLDVGLVPVEVYSDGGVGLDELLVLLDPLEDLLPPSATEPPAQPPSRPNARTPTRPSCGLDGHQVRGHDQATARPHATAGTGTTSTTTTATATTTATTTTTTTTTTETTTTESARWRHDKSKTCRIGLRSKAPAVRPPPPRCECAADTRHPCVMT